MGRRPWPEQVAMSIRVPRGQECFWRLMQEACRAGGQFTLAGLDARSNVETATIRDYLRRLVRSGHVAEAGQDAAGRTTYVIARPSAEAPRLRRDGTTAPRAAQWRLWSAMRGLKRGFTVRELAFAGGLDEPVPLPTAARYVRHLRAAGYIVRLGPARGPRGDIWRLARDTGPRPPRILRTHAVWDDNALEIMGEAQTEVCP